MGNDMVSASRQASANQTSLFALNHHAPSAEHPSLILQRGQTHEPGEYSTLRQLRLPETRHSATVLALQTPGQWGYEYGVNEHRVALGVTSWETRFSGDAPTFHGSDLVRLMLERGQSARSAIDTAIDLLSRHGEHESARGNIFLVADAEESFVLETAGQHWALLECGPTRVVTDAAMIRQDWRRLAPGLATEMIEKGQWEDDGSKLDFVRCLSTSSDATLRAQRRWGRASLALAQQQGAIDLHFLRRMLADHYNTNRDLLQPAKATRLASTFLVDLQSGDVPIIAWHAFGKPKVALFFPICLAGELPEAFRADADQSIQKCTAELRRLTRGKDGMAVVHALERLQVKFDQDADDLLARATEARRRGDAFPIASCASEMMSHHVAMFRAEFDRLVGTHTRKPQFVPAEQEEVLYFA